MTVIYPRYGQPFNQRPSLLQIIFTRLKFSLVQSIPSSIPDSTREPSGQEEF